MSQFTKVAREGAIAPDRGQTFTVGDRLVAVYYVDGQYFAIDDLCPHMGASLGAGEVEEGIVACPWHAWRFKVSDGTWCDNPKVSIDAFEVRVQDGAIWVSNTPTPKNSGEADAK
jgi:nitrite reductase (NADH) small subunit/3-phenylpropionate/trans-cinnamate dioxygenase ferredoxin subunit